MTSVAETDFDDVLKDITKKIPGDKIDDLGKALGFEYTENENFIARNKSGASAFAGTLKMLREWREKQTNPDEKAALRKYLKDAGLNRLANLPILQGDQKQHHQATTSSFPGPTASSPASSGRQQVPVENPSTSASNVHSTNSLGRTVTDKELQRLAGRLHADYYISVAMNLGLEFTDYDNIQRQNAALRDANFKMLMKWKCKNGGKMSDLDEALNEADCALLYKENAQ